MEAIFNRCLRSVISVDLWVFYLNYIRRIHNVHQLPPDKVDEARATVSQAYDFALGNIGFDKDSAVVWSEYLQFIKSGEVKNNQKCCLGAEHCWW
jgi:cleavage stimulation factor subunit 3